MKGVFSNLVSSMGTLSRKNTTVRRSESDTSAPSTPKISGPYDAKHVTHVGFNFDTGEFTGLPKPWQKLLSESGISKVEAEQHPQAVMDIMAFTPIRRTTEFGRSLGSQSGRFWGYCYHALQCPERLFSHCVSWRHHSYSGSA